MDRVYCIISGRAYQTLNPPFLVYVLQRDFCHVQRDVVTVEKVKPLAGAKVWLDVVQLDKVATIYPAAVYVLENATDDPALCFLEHVRRGQPCDWRRGNS